jgi:hypothetical protein
MPAGRNSGREEKADRDDVDDHVHVNVDVDVVAHVLAVGRCGLFENPGPTTLNADRAAQVLCLRYSQLDSTRGTMK